MPLIKSAYAYSEPEREFTFAKMCFKFLIKTGGVCDHLNFTRETVPRGGVVSAHVES